MKVFQIPRCAALLVGVSLITGLGVPSAYADFTFGEPVTLQSVIPVFGGASDIVDCLSRDGLEMYVSSYIRPGGCGWYDLWVLKRPSVEQDWAPPENLGSVINSSKAEIFSCISGDRLTLYFESDRLGSYGNGDIWVTTRSTKDDPWGPAVNLGLSINSSAFDETPWISPDGLELYFTSDRPGGYGGVDIYVAKRATTNDPWGEAVNLGAAVNSGYHESYSCLSPDGLLLLFADPATTETVRPGGYGGPDMWMARRARLSDPWQSPVNLGPIVNGPKRDCWPRLSSDGRTLYFWSFRSGANEMWQAPIIPIVDFNADGQVDLADLVLLIDNWGTDNTLYDIGPFAWGDGKVDIEDLKAFVAEWERENPANSSGDH